MSQLLTQIEGILKDKYQPAIANQINIEPSPFLEKIKKVPLTNNTIKFAAPFGINGGFGFGAEGSATPRSGAQKYVSFSLDAIDMYVDVKISNKTVELASSNASAMINALDTEIKGSYASAKWNLGRALFGDGSGKLAKVTSLPMKDETVNCIYVDDTSKLIEGLIVDIYSYRTADGMTPVLEECNKGLRIIYVDHEGKIVYFDKADFDWSQKNDDGDSYGFLTVQNSYNRELCGLGAIFDNTVDELYGLKKSKNEWIKPIVYNCDNNVTDIDIYAGVKKAKDYKGADIDLIMMGDNAFKTYQEYMRANNVVVTEKHRFVGGAVGYKVLAGSQEVIIVNERFVPKNEAWGVDTKTFMLQCTPWNFMSKDGGIFVPMADTSIYRALLASYGNLICTNPGGCVRFIACASNI